ncbi:MAG TPA: prolipoprotein diacylglyceryl transferase family protein [Chitinophagales bacterium]|nr:prolipoprotein diacylglyceryl transferase family protein [Chitinophagales bacterium]
MYPTISDLIKDLTGIYIPLPIQSFGFMMAVAFLFAAWTLALELKRKEKQGLLHAVPRKILVGKPASVSDLVMNGIIGFILGFKIIEMILHYHDLVEDPQDFILSTRGNLIGGIVVAGLMMFLKYREKEKERLPNPEEKTILVSPYQMVGDITIIAAIFGLLGAKIFDNLEHLDDFFKDPLGAIFSFSGLAFYGGLILGAAGVLWYARRNKIPLVHMLDSAAPGLILAYGVGRIGCQLAGDGDWGIVNMHPKPSWWFLPDWTWAFNYPHNVIQEGTLIPGCTGKFCYQLAEPVYPTPLYETTIAILIFLFLWSIRKKIQTPGMLFSIYLVLNGIERFFMENIRVDIRYHFLGMTATQAQIIAVIMVILGIAGIILSRRGRSTQTTP